MRRHRNKTTVNLSITAEQHKKMLKQALNLTGYEITYIHEVSSYPGGSCVVRCDILEPTLMGEVGANALMALVKGQGF